MTISKSVLSRWSVGDRLSDEELIELNDAYQKVADATFLFGEKYSLVCDDARKGAQNTRDFLEARGYGKKAVTA
jgi:hypothetical protein